MARITLNTGKTSFSVAADVPLKSGFPASSSGKTRVLGYDRGKIPVILPNGQSVVADYTLSIYTKDDIDETTPKEGEGEQQQD